MTSKAYVVNTKGLDVGDAVDAEVYFTEPLVEAALNGVAIEDGPDAIAGFLEATGASHVSVRDLITIAELAVAVLDSEYAGKPEDVARLAVALKTGGFKDLTHLFPEVV